MPGQSGKCMCESRGGMRSIINEVGPEEKKAGSFLNGKPPAIT